MKKQYIVDIDGILTVIEETLPTDGKQHAEWKIIRAATFFDRIDAKIPKHPYFRFGTIPA